MYLFKIFPRFLISILLKRFCKIISMMINEELKPFTRSVVNYMTLIEYNQSQRLFLLFRKCEWEKLLKFKGDWTTPQQYRQYLQWLFQESSSSLFFVEVRVVSYGSMFIHVHAYLQLYIIFFFRRFL